MVCKGHSVCMRIVRSIDRMSSFFIVNVLGQISLFFMDVKIDLNLKGYKNVSNKHRSRIRYMILNLYPSKFKKIDNVNLTMLSNKATESKIESFLPSNYHFNVRQFDCLFLKKEHKKMEQDF